MQFIQSPFLYALAGLAIPVIIHMIFRWQTRRVDLGTTRFLAELLRETSRRRKVKRWLLLAMRLGCVALLAVLFARPYLLAKQAGSERKLLVLLIDRSASMALAPDGTRRLDAALDHVRQLVAELGPNSDVEAAYFDSVVTPLETAVNDGRLDAAAWSAPEQLWGGTSYGAAMSWARDICLKSDAAERHVHIFTDLQRSGLDWTDTAPFPEEVQVHVEDLGHDVGNNAAVIRVHPSRTLLRPGQGTSVEATLFNFGQFSHDDLPVLLTLKNGARTVRLQQKASLRPGEATEVIFEVVGVDAGLWEAAVVLDVEDDLPFDNARQFALLAAPQQKVLVIDGSSIREGGIPETWFLERALRLSGREETGEPSPFEAAVVRLEQESLPTIQGFDLVVLVNVAQLASSEAERLAAFVRDGGGLLVFTGDQMTPTGCRTLSDVGLAPGEIRGITTTRDLPYRWEVWDDRHLALAPFADPQNGDLRRLGHLTYTDIAPAATTKVLATFNGGAPALTEQTLGKGRVLWFLSGCTREWSDWVRSRLFLPLVHQLLGDLAELTGGGPIQDRLLGDASPVLGLPAGETLPDPSRPAITKAHDRWYVFNVNPRESESDRCTPQEFAERFRFQWIPDAAGGGVAAATLPEATGTETRRDEVWPWIACALVGLLGLEWFLANRTTA